jgi:putative component of membrane protein insertase Oxa1/YidC/SpoIIIJ protein YidD
MKLKRKKNTPKDIQKEDDLGTWACHSFSIFLIGFYVHSLPIDAQCCHIIICSEYGISSTAALKDIQLLQAFSTYQQHQ